MSTTKQRILTVSLDLFNRFGYMNIRMQHIADEAQLSVGNLAYHFKNTETLFEALYEQLQKQQEALLSELKIVPLFVNMDTHFASMYDLQITYKFFYSETFELLRNFPEIKWQYRTHCRWFMQQLETLLQFNAARGAMKSLSAEETQQLAEQLWMVLHLWLYQLRLRGEEDLSVERFKQTVWQVLKPHFTPIGDVEFKQLGSYQSYNWL